MIIGFGIKRVSVNVPEKLIDRVVEIINSDFVNEFQMDRDDVVELALMDFLLNYSEKMVSQEVQLPEIAN